MPAKAQPVEVWVVEALSLEHRTVWREVLQDRALAEALQKKTARAGLECHCWDLMRPAEKPGV